MRQPIRYTRRFRYWCVCLALGLLSDLVAFCLIGTDYSCCFSGVALLLIGGALGLQVRNARTGN